MTKNKDIGNTINPYKNIFIEIFDGLSKCITFVDMKQKCPLCHGHGEVDINPLTKRDAHRKMAKDMRKKGLTIRQIMGALGYKHPGSVSNLLK